MVKTYKDSLFRSLFNTEEAALAILNALYGTNYTEETTKVVINTLNESLWTSKKNDLSFIIGDELVIIIEHQSTINENMPLRFLQIVCRIYESLIADKRELYKKKLLKLPRPRFIVFYNGREKFVEFKLSRLFDAFKEVAGFEGISLELEVEIYNFKQYLILYIYLYYLLFLYVITIY